MTAKKPKREHKPAGRPKKIGPNELRKIEEAAAYDASVEEMAFYAGVHRQTLYRYLEAHPEFGDRITELRERPILEIRQSVVQQAKLSYANGMDYLARKRKKEFSLRTEMTGADGKDIGTPIMPLPSHVPPDNSNA